MQTNNMKKPLVFGLGVTGISVSRYFFRHKIPFFYTDDHLEKALRKKECEFLLQIDFATRIEEEERESILLNVSKVVVSPGIAPLHPLLQSAQKKQIEICGDIELALQLLALKKTPLVAITGTNGKTTVTELTQAMLLQKYPHTKAVGNIGVPILDVCEEAQEKQPLVVELSSFQIDALSSAVFDAACVLNITPDHLDYHGSMDNYRHAKMRLKSFVKKDGVFFINEMLKDKTVSTSLYFGYNTASEVYTDGCSIFRYGKKEIELPQILRDRKSHDVENFLAAYAMARALDVAPEMCIDAFLAYKKPAHRIEFIREIEGVNYYDDSKGTNIDAVVRAVESLPGEIILIAGGVHKGERYTAWREGFQGKVKAIFVIGQAAMLIKEDLDTSILDTRIPVTCCKTLEDAVNEAKACAQPGQTVLLSPGCSSFDMFKDYKERGNMFQSYVRAL